MRTLICICGNKIPEHRRKKSWGTGSYTSVSRLLLLRILLPTNKKFIPLHFNYSLSLGIVRRMEHLWQLLLYLLTGVREGENGTRISGPLLVTPEVVWGKRKGYLSRRLKVWTTLESQPRTPSRPLSSEFPSVSFRTHNLCHVHFGSNSYVYEHLLLGQV